MARRERKVVPVMVYLEPALATRLNEVVEDEDDHVSTYLRSLLVKELHARGRLTPEDHAALGSLVAAR